MEDWIGVLGRARESLESILSEESKPETSNTSQDRTECLLDSIVAFTKLKKGHKWLSNFEVAAMHLNVHMQVSFMHLCV